MFGSSCSKKTSTKVTVATSAKHRSNTNASAGEPILSHASGKTSLEDNASDITEDSILGLASCTKLLTTIAALKLVEAGHLSLDDPKLIENHLPELCALEVITSVPGEPLSFAKRSKPLTLRALLTHSSGVGYDMLSPQLQTWRQARGEAPKMLSAPLPEAVATPLLFQPGEGWVYGGGLDWVGLLVECVSGMRLSEYMRKEIFDVVRCDGRIGFNKEALEDVYGIVQTVTRNGEGQFVNFPYPPVEQKSDRGGGGVYASARNFLKVLVDLVSEEPKLLRAKTLDLLFAPQFTEGSQVLEALCKAKPIFDSMTGALTGGMANEHVNHALGGLLITGDHERLGSTEGTMAWGGAFNCLWIVNRKLGIAAFYGSSMFPPGEKESSILLEGFIKEVWGKIGLKSE